MNQRDVICLDWLYDRTSSPRHLGDFETRSLRIIRHSQWIFQLAVIWLFVSWGVSIASDKISEGKTGNQATMAAVLENWNRINFWNGTAIVDDWETSDGGRERHATNKIEFFLDRGSRQLRWRSTLTLDPEGAPLSSAASATHVDRMVKHCALYRPLGQTIQIEELRAPQGPFANQEFDLLSVLTGGIDDMAGVLCRVGGNFQFPADWQSNPMNLEQVDRLEARHDDVTSTIAIDKSNTETLATLERRTPKRTEDWRFTYQRVGSIWLPSEVEINWRETDVAKKGRRVIRFSRSVVNQNIDSSEFTLAKLGARSGDLIRDTRANVQYLHNGSNESTPENGTNTPARAKNDPWLLYVTLNVAGWVAFLGSYAVWVRRKSKINHPKPPHVNNGI